MSDSLLQEIDDALKADRAAQLWQKYRSTIVTFVAVVILGTAANSIWQHYRESRGGEMLVAFTDNQKLLESGKADDAAAGFKKIADGAQGELQDLALIWQARALSAAGKKDEAIAALKTAVADGSHGLWTDVACLRLAGLDTKEATCLDAKANSPLASTRAEWAAANAWANGDKDAAIASIEKLIADENTSSDSRERLSQWLNSMKSQKDAK